MFHEFITSERPDLKPIQALHRGSNGFVTFHRNVGGTFENGPAVPAAELDHYFPQFVGWQETDSYHSVNAMWRSGRRGPSEVVDGLQKAERGNVLTRWITAAFVDIDYYARGLTFGEALGKVVDLQLERKLPPASMLQKSGRGLWAFWFLNHGASEPGKVPKDGPIPEDGPMRAWPENVERWNRVQRELYGRLAHIGGDPQALDLARITRVAGSVNSKADATVAYWIQADKQGKAYTYTLSELAERIGVPKIVRQPRVKAMLSQAQQDRNQRGYAGGLKKRLRQFETLRALRDGFREGHRYRASMLYRDVLTRCARLTDRELPMLTPSGVDDAVRQLASECRDARGRPLPLDADDVDDALRAEPFRLTNQKMADWLDVTRDEAAAMSEDWPNSDPFPCAFRFKTKEERAALKAAEQKAAKPKPMSKTEKRVARQAWLQSFVEKRGGRVPPLRQIAAALFDELGLSACAMTLGKDLAALGIPNARRHRKLDEQPTLPLDSR